MLGFELGTLHDFGILIARLISFFGRGRVTRGRYVCPRSYHPTLLLDWWQVVGYLLSSHLCWQVVKLCELRLYENWETIPWDDLDWESGWRGRLRVRVKSYLGVRWCVRLRSWRIWLCWGLGWLRRLLFWVCSDDATLIMLSLLS